MCYFAERLQDPCAISYALVQLVALLSTSFFHHDDLLAAPGFQAWGCHVSLGPLARFHGSATVVFCVLGSCSCTSDVTVFSLPSICPLCCGCVFPVFRVGTGCPLSSPGRSIKLGFASHLASAWAAKTWRRSRLASSCVCSVKDGGLSRWCRNH